MGNKQANDIAQATTPFVQPTLENLPTAIQQTFAGRSIDAS